MSSICRQERPCRLSNITMENSEFIIHQLITAWETGLVYDRRWPALCVMLSGWLEPEIAAAGELLKGEAAFAFEKLPLNLSVAHLGCLLKLFVEEHLLGDISLTDLFKFSARHYRTKK